MAGGPPLRALRVAPFPPSEFVSQLRSSVFVRSFVPSTNEAGGLASRALLVSLRILQTLHYSLHYRLNWVRARPERESARVSNRKGKREFDGGSKYSRE